MRRLGGWLPEAASAAVAVVAAFAVAGSAMARGFPVDDAWIHMVYGLSLRTTGTFAYNDGVAGAGATSPLWALVAALAHAVVGVVEPSEHAAFALKLASVVSHAAAAWLSARLGRATAASAAHATPSALAAGLVVASCPALAYAGVSGMEVGLTSALLLGAFVAAAREQTLATGVLVGLAICARPEAVVALPLAFGLAVASRAGGLRARARRVAPGLGVAVALPGLWVLRNVLVTGRPLPSTVYAKAVGLRAADLGASIGTAFFEVLGKSRPLNRGVVWGLVGLMVVFAWRALRERLRPGVDASGSASAPASALVGGAVAVCGIAYVVGLSAHTRFVEPGTFYYQRYLLPVLPLLLVAACAAVSHALERVARLLRHGGRIAPGALVAVGVAVAAWEADAWAKRRDRYEADVAAIDAVQVAIGRFVATGPPDAVVWSVDAGAPRYFGRRRVVDLVKLNTPELLVTEDVDAAWAPDLVVLVVPYGYRASADGKELPTLFEAPVDWAARPLPAGWPSRMPTQRVHLCAPAGSPLTVTRGPEVQARGRCAIRDGAGARPRP